MTEPWTPDSVSPGASPPAPGELPADLPAHAKERLLHMRQKRFFTSDLSVSEFLLVKEVGFEPLGMVMGSSIYRIRPNVPMASAWSLDDWRGELGDLTQALYHSRELAMSRMEEEADALGADGIIGVRLKINLHAWGSDIAEFVAIGTAVRHAGGGNFRNKANRPFQSDLSGQDFWTLIKAGYRPVGMVMGNCAYFVPPSFVNVVTGSSRSTELAEYTHALYDARELAIERLQAEAEDVGATGIVAVTVQELQHSWRGQFGSPLAGQFQGEIIEFFSVGTAIVPYGEASIGVPTIAVDAGR
jgi:uncharacterized protein YbjQ (UPF0145 family)